MGLGGVFVVFEGGEGAGKSTQVQHAAARGRAANLEVVVTREPGGTPFGEAIRAALLHGRGVPARAELFAFTAARAALVDEVIAPALARGALVLCDRFTASTVAYQQYGRGLPAGLVQQAIELGTGGLTPDLQVLLDTPPAQGLERAGAASDRFEAESLGFHGRVREGFRAQAASDPSHWLVLDATLPADELASVVWSAIESNLSRS